MGHPRAVVTPCRQTSFPMCCTQESAVEIYFRQCSQDWSFIIWVRQYQFSFNKALKSKIFRFKFDFRRDGTMVKAASPKNGSRQQFSIKISKNITTFLFKIFWEKSIYMCIWARCSIRVYIWYPPSWLFHLLSSRVEGKQQGWKNGELFDLILYSTQQMVDECVCIWPVIY